MTYGAKLNIALAVGLGAMLLVAWLMQRDAQHLQPMLSELAFDQVETIRIELPNHPAMAFERVVEGWLMRLPLEIDVDPRRMEEIVNALRVPSQTRYPAAQLPLTAVGLADPPVARVMVNGEVFTLGATNPVSRLRYVMRGEVVHLVADLLYFRLSSDPQGWVRRQPLPAGSRIARIEAGDFDIVRTEGGWALERPTDIEANPDALQRVVDAWANAQAFEVGRWEGPLPFENVANIWIDGRDEPIEFILRKSEDMMVLIRPDNRLEYRLPLYRAEDFWIIPDLQD